MPKLTVRQWPIRLDARGDTVLNVALSAGVPYPHGCRIGECGFCKSRLLAGEVTMSPYDEAILSPAERESGLILACRAHIQSDVHVAWLAENLCTTVPVQRLRAEVTNIETVTPLIRRLYVWPERPLQFAAGQYARLGFANISPRSYSMANRPDETVLEFHIRLIEGGAVSNHIATKLRPGDVVRLEGPFGSSYLPPRHQGPIVAVAGGSGLAPVKSIVKTSLHAGTTQPIHLFFRARSEKHVYDEAQLLELAARYPNLRLEILLSTAGPGSTRRTIPIARAAVEALSGLEAPKLYVAGPPTLVTAVAKAAEASGMPAENIHGDSFFSSGDPVPAPPETLSERLQRGTRPRWFSLRRAASA